MLLTLERKQIVQTHMQVCKYTEVEFTKARLYVKMLTQLYGDGGITDD